MQKIVIFLVLSTLLFNNSFSQQKNYRTTVLNNNSNYFEIVKQKRAELAPLKNKTDRRSKKALKQFERWAAFWKDRITPNGNFVPQSFAYKQFEKEKKRYTTYKSKTAVTSAATNWSFIGPATQPNSSVSFYPGMGRLNTIAFNGTDTNTLYVGSPSGGVWKTTDAGNTWSPKTDYLANIGVSHLIIDPNNTNILYLASGDADFIHTRSIGVYKSTNAGDSWSLTGLKYLLTENGIISKLLIDPNNSNIVFATTRNSIKKTTNGGTTWTNVFTENDAIFNDIAYKIGSSTIIYATSRAGKFYSSTDNGTNWFLVSTPSNSRLDLALTANDTDLIMTLDEAGKIRKSTDAGVSWTEVSTIANYNSQNAFNMALAISPIDKNLILAGGVDGWRSKDGGATWERYLDGYWEEGLPYFYVHSDHHDMVFVPGTNSIFSVNDGGINKGDASLDTNWTDLSSGLAITQYYMISGTPQNTNLLIMGAQDNDIAVYDGTNFKGQHAGSDGVEGLWDYSNSDIAWMCSQEGFMTRTLDGFATSVALDIPEGAPFVWEVEIHPTIPTTIFAGLDDIYKSTDRGDNWTNLNSGVGTIEYISIAPSNANTIYVSGENGEVKKTTNGGTSWSEITLPQSGFVKSIEVHPTNPTEIYIAYSGYQNGKVYKSIDGGDNFTNITGSLPNIPTHQIRYKTGSTNDELFLATDLGVYYRNNIQADWVQLGTGLPNVIVSDIAIDYESEKLRVATFGRGVWEISITNTALGIDNNQLAKNAISLYPNPTNNKNFSIKLNNLEGKSNISVYNVIGSVVKTFSSENQEEKVDLSDFSRGLYFVKVTNNGKSITKKILVK